MKVTLPSFGLVGFKGTHWKRLPLLAWLFQWNPFQKNLDVQPTASKLTLQPLNSKPTAIEACREKDMGQGMLPPSGDSLDGLHTEPTPTLGAAVATSSNGRSAKVATGDLSPAKTLQLPTDKSHSPENKVAGMRSPDYPDLLLPRPCYLGLTQNEDTPKKEDMPPHATGGQFAHFTTILFPCKLTWNKPSIGGFSKMVPLFGSPFSRRHRFHPPSPLT